MGDIRGYCTDCGHEITITGGRCPCGSGRVIIASPAPSLPEDVERVVERLEEPHHMDRLDAEAAALIRSYPRPCRKGR